MIQLGKLGYLQYEATLHLLMPPSDDPGQVLAVLEHDDIVLILSPHTQPNRFGTRWWLVLSKHGAGWVFDDAVRFFDSTFARGQARE